MAMSMRIGLTIIAAQPIRVTTGPMRIAESTFPRTPPRAIIRRHSTAGFIIRGPRRFIIAGVTRAPRGTDIMAVISRPTNLIHRLRIG